MGVDVHDLRDRTRFLHANWWQWRPTVELIRSLGLFDADRLDALSGGVGEFSRDEAHQIAELFDRTVLPRVGPGERVLLDGSVTSSSDDGTFYRDPDEQHRNYSVDGDWLLQFVEFSRGSAGLYIC